MKSKILFILMMGMVAVVPTVAKTKNSGQPLAKFDTTVWDFGNIRDDRPVSHDFEFINVGNGNFVVIDATAQCGCTRPEYPAKPVAPGKREKVKVTFNPLGRAGSFEKTVTLVTNGKPKKIRLKVRGNVVPSK